MDSPIIYYLVVAFLTAIFCFALVYALSKPFYKLAITAVSQINTILDRKLDEDEKDKLLLQNLKNLILYLFLNLSFLVLITLGCLLIFNWLVGFEDFQPIDSSSWLFYASMIIGSLPLLFIRKKHTDYTYWSKLLHEIILQNYGIARYLHRKQRKANSNSITNKAEVNFVVINGLARAGTTALTTMLFQSKNFHSTTYASMPFLMAPKLWEKIYKPKNAKKKERAHGDQVEFSEQSVEALEEYFFKAFLNDSFIKEDRLLVHDIDQETYHAYLSFQEAYRSNKDTLYLTKNNNSILRYSALRNLNDQFHYFILFREPIEHANSLKKQHQNFTLKQDTDSFVLQYMNWLGHHEFGNGLKPFEFSNAIPFGTSDPSDINFWIISWINYYQYVLGLATHPKTKFIAYQDLLKEPKKVISGIGKLVQKKIEVELKPFTPRVDKSRISECDKELYDQAIAIYQQLIQRKMSLT